MLPVGQGGEHLSPGPRVCGGGSGPGTPARGPAAVDGAPHADSPPACFSGWPAFLG